MNAWLGMMFGWHEVMLREWMHGWGWCLDDMRLCSGNECMVGDDVWMTWGYVKGMHECRIGDDVWMTWGYVEVPDEGLGMIIGWQWGYVKGMNAGLGMMFGWHEGMLRAWMQGWGWCLDDMTLCEGHECRVGGDVWMTWRYVKVPDEGLEMMFGWQWGYVKGMMNAGLGWCLHDMTLCEGHECRVGGDVWMTWRYGKGMNAGLGMMFGWHDVMGRAWMQGWGWCLDDMRLC